MVDTAGKNPRKQPRQSRSTATYGAILEAAARILETRGLEAANTNAIADLAGISVGSLYQYFPDKSAIFAEMIRIAERDTADAVEALLIRTEGLSFEVRLHHLVQAGVAQQMARPRLARTLDALEMDMPEDVALASTERRIIGLIECFLEEHRDEVDDPVNAIMARDVLSIVKGMVDGASIAGETDAGDLANRVERAVLGYLCAGRSDG
jgi:AcrR family transcriptional regulator